MSADPNKETETVLNALEDCGQPVVRRCLDAQCRHHLTNHGTWRTPFGPTIANFGACQIPGCKCLEYAEPGCG